MCLTFFLKNSFVIFPLKIQKGSPTIQAILVSLLIYYVLQGMFEGVHRIKSHLHWESFLTRLQTLNGKVSDEEMSKRVHDRSKYTERAVKGQFQKLFPHHKIIRELPCKS